MALLLTLSVSTSPLTRGVVGRITGGDADAGTYGAGSVDFLDFGSTQKNKTIRSLGGYANTAGAGYHIRLDSVAWLNTAAITSLTFKAQTGSEDFIARDSHKSLRREGIAMTVTPTYIPLATTTLASVASSVTFGSIPATYR
jgi:hypothetical protein